MVNTLLGNDVEANRDVDQAVQLGVNRTEVERVIEELKKQR